MKIKIVLSVVFSLQLLFAQQFSEDIIIQGPQPDETWKGTPVIDIDSQGTIGIAWAVNYTDHYTINFVKSTDGGETFDSIRTVHDIPYNSDWGWWGTPQIVYDIYDNPLVFYYAERYPWDDVYRLKKSGDQGNSFPENFQEFISSGGNSFGFLLEDSGVGFLALQADTSRKILMRKTSDFGHSFQLDSIIDTKQYAPIHFYKILRCSNNDLLYFWTGQDIITHENMIFFNRSSDNGNSFGENVKLDTVNFSPVGINAAVNDNKIIITYTAKNKFTDRVDLKYKISFDCGYTWTNDEILYLFEHYLSNHPSQSMIYNSNVGLCISWGDYSLQPNTKILFTRSKNFGTTFDSISIITNEYRNRFQNSMAISDSGNIYIVSIDDSSNLILNKAKTDLITGINKSKQTNPIEEYTLFQNSPNPFNPQTAIRYALPVASHVSVTIYNTLGQQVKTMDSGRQSAGSRELIWDGKDKDNRDLPSGMYVYRLRAVPVAKGRRAFSAVGKMLLLR